MPLCIDLAFSVMYKYATVTTIIAWRPDLKSSEISERWSEGKLGIISWLYCVNVISLQWL